MKFLNLLSYLLIGVIGFFLGYFEMGFNTLGFWILLTLIIAYGLVNELRGSQINSQEKVE